MASKITDYFDGTVMPMIRTRHSEILAEMSIMILGSVGLGIDDAHSDMEAAIYLEDSVWKKSGGQLQLSLNECLMEKNPWRREGSVIAVYPVSWLLDGHAGEFLAHNGEHPWEKVSYETLFTIQNNLIVHDPKNVLKRLRTATAPSQYPDNLWKKALLCQLKLIYGDLPELKLNVMRHHQAEAHIMLGRVIEDLLHLGFFICRRYYPWRSHLRWAFDGLDMPIRQWGSEIDGMLKSDDWNKKIDVLETVVAACRDFIAAHGLLPEVDMRSSDLKNELLWAERLRAWENADWRDWIMRCTAKAQESGYASDQFWVWSLWGWADDRAN